VSASSDESFHSTAIGRWLEEAMKQGAGTTYVLDAKRAGKVRRVGEAARLVPSNSRTPPAGALSWFVDLKRRV
jgi:hypothetical protein